MSEIKLLFVYTGNNCRSSMAEAVMKHLIEKQSLHWKIDCAGLKDWNVGCSPDIRCVRVLQEHGLLPTICDRMISETDFKHYTFILVMEGNNLAELKKMEWKVKKKGPRYAEYAHLEMLNEYVLSDEDMVVADPSNRPGWHEVKYAFEHTVKCCQKFIGIHSIDSRESSQRAKRRCIR